MEIKLGLYGEGKRDIIGKTFAVAYSDFSIALYEEKNGVKFGIDNAWLERNNLTREEAYRLAQKNMEKEFEFMKLTDIIKSIGKDIAQTLGDITDEKNIRFNEEKFEKEVPDILYVLGNKKAYEGAAVIFSPEVMDRFCKAVGSDNIILMPITCHDVVAITAEDEKKHQFDCGEYCKAVYGEMNQWDRCSSRPLYYDNVNRAFHPYKEMQLEKERPRTR